MEAYLAEVRKMEKQFLGLELQHVPRGTNKEADDIARRASKRQPQEPGVFEERSLQAIGDTTTFKHSSASGGASTTSCLRSPGLWPDLRSSLALGA